MAKNINFSVFGDSEDKYAPGLRALKDKLLLPVTSYLNKTGVKPDWLTYASLLMILPFIYFFKFNPWISLIFLVLNILLDGIDGSMARINGNSSVKGAVLDTAADNLSFIIVFFTAFYYNLFNPFWGGIYITNYIGLIFLVIISKGLKLNVFPVIRSRFYFFLLLFVLLFSGLNYFDYFHVLLGVYMIITNIFLFQRIRWEL
jgi:phosphatidylglycerophosphate synthase